MTLNIFVNKFRIRTLNIKREAEGDGSIYLLQIDLKSMLL